MLLRVAVAISLSLWLDACRVVGAEPALQKVHDSLVDSKALTIDGAFGQAINGKSFQQDAIASHAGRQYVGYYDANRRVCLARRQLPAGPWKLIRFDDYHFESNDAHNTISLGICPGDGTIHLAFDHHGHPLHYRASRPGAATQPDDMPWEASIFGPVTSELEPGRSVRLTYPRFWATPDGNLQFSYRVGGSGNGDRLLVDYDARTHRWSKTRAIDSGQGAFLDALGGSPTRNSYPNGYGYGPDGKLHVTWVWREKVLAMNHDLLYAYSEDGGRSWRNNGGDPLESPPHIGSPGVKVVHIPRGYGLMNTGGQAVDSRGRIHAVVWHATDESLAAAGAAPAESQWGPHEARRNHHYWRDDVGEWRHSELPGLAGSRPKICFDRDDNGYVLFGRRSEDWKGANTHPENGLVVLAATAASGWTDWREAYVDDGAYVNEMLYDAHRWQQDEILSILLQETPARPHDPTPLRVLDLGRR